MDSVIEEISHHPDARVGIIGENEDFCMVRGVLKSFLGSFPIFFYIILLFTALFFGVWAYWLIQNTNVKIEWSTASELNTIGFNLYRRDSADSSEIRINPELIPGSSDPLTGADYEYVDRNVQPGKTYLYELEDVEADGTTNRSWNTSVKVARQGLIEGGIALVLGLYALSGILFCLFINRNADV